MQSLHIDSRLPRSGSAALAAGALFQVAVGIEFLLAGLSKLLDPDFVTQFTTFIGGSPGSRDGFLAPVLQSLVLPNAAVAARLATFVEIGAGLVLLVSAFEVMRRRFDGPFGAPHGYEPTVALVSAGAALAVAVLSTSIYVLEGGGLPRIGAAHAFGSPIAVELLLVPMALGIAWLETARFFALRRGT